MIREVGGEAIFIKTLGKEGWRYRHTASDHRLAATEDRPAYGRSKHGVIILIKASALEYANANIQVQAVCSGLTRTGSSFETHLVIEEKIVEIPMERFRSSIDITKAVVWLCSDAASCVTGLAMTVDGALSHGNGSLYIRLLSQCLRS